MKVDIYNKKGTKTKNKVDLNKNVFCIKPNEHSIYLAVKSELAAKRQGTSSSKNRSEVRGGGTKPWKQKGTGRARIGSLRNPSRVHGGAAFGPEPRQYSLKVNKKVKKLARKSALSMKISSDSYMVLDDLILKSCKTKDFFTMLNHLKVAEKKIFMITCDLNNEIYLGSRNLNNVKSATVNSFSTGDLMNSNFLIIDKNSVVKLNETLV